MSYGADEKVVNEKIKRAVEAGAVADLSPDEISTQAFQRALANPSIAQGPQKPPWIITTGGSLADAFMTRAWRGCGLRSARPCRCRA